MDHKRFWSRGFVALSVLAAAAGFGFAAEDSQQEEIVAELTEVLVLSDEQAEEVGRAIEKFTAGLHQATELSDGEGEDEPDPQAMLSAVKKERAAYREAMKSILSEEQFAKYQEYVDKVVQEVFDDLAEIKLLDLKPALDLTDDQITDLSPVMGTAMRDLLGVVYEYGDKRMNIRTKLKVGKKLKGIQSDMESGIAKVLTDEQMKKYEAYKEENKAKRS